MAQGVRETERKDPYGRKPALADVTGFLKSNWRFIVLLTLLLSAAMVVVALLLPQQYSKRLTLRVTTLPTELLSTLGQPVLDEAQAGNLTVGYLQNANIEGVNVSPTYNVATRQVSVALQSRDGNALGAAVPALVDLLEEEFREVYEEPLGAALEAQVSSLEREVGASEEAIELVDREVEGALTGDPEDPRTMARVEGLETARANTLTEVAKSEAEIRELQDARRDLPELAGEPVAVEVLSESDAPQARSLVPVVALTLILGLAGAVAAAVVRAALRGVS